MSSCSFSNALENKNIAIFKTKKDECEICSSFKTGNIDRTKYESHIIKKDEARSEKESDKINENFVYTMDLQAVLMSPKSNVSSLYYKMKLKVHNFGIFVLKTKDAKCFVWNETEGSVGSDEFASIVSRFIVEIVYPKMQESEKSNSVIFWSDGCTAQNRNATMSNALLNVAISYNITIYQKFLEKGHTQMEVDSIHASIERKMKNKIINIPADYVDVCNDARKIPKPYDTEYLSFDYFSSHKNLRLNNSIQPGKKRGDKVVVNLRALLKIFSTG